MSLDTVHDRATDDDGHGIRGAVYQRRAPDGLMCVLECLCGAIFVGDTWEEAGADLDHHLEGYA